MRRVRLLDALGGEMDPGWDENCLLPSSTGWYAIASIWILDPSMSPLVTHYADPASQPQTGRCLSKGITGMYTLLACSTTSGFRDPA